MHRTIQAVAFAVILVVVLLAGCKKGEEWLPDPQVSVTVPTGPYG